MTNSYTPMIEQYLEIKHKHSQDILFFRLGDFYEMFFSDAETAAKELEITLTARDGGSNTKIPMCGIPYHAAESYIAKLINKGYKVAICEQVEDPKQCKGIVRREVVKVITPGTIMLESLLSDRGNNFLAALYEEGNDLTLTTADITTGECAWIVFSGPHRINELCDQLFHLLPSELVLTGKIEGWTYIQSFLDHRIPHCVITSLTVNDYDFAHQLPSRHFSSDDLPNNKHSYTAVGFLLYYLHQTIKSDLSHINRLIKNSLNDFLLIDASTMRNLEITRNTRDGSKRDTLLSVLDFTKTAMGGRQLRKWLEYPLLKPTQIGDRHDAVAELVSKPSIRKALQDILSGVYDFERILSRIEVGTANARDLIALKNSLALFPDIKESLHSLESTLLVTTCRAIHIHQDIVQLISSAIVDNPPFSIREGEIIKTGYDIELDELRTISRDSKQWIQDLESREREKTGIKSLKVGYNKVFGYYLEVTNANIDNVPDNYVRKQTLANAERYITPQLKEFETKILGAQEKIISIEHFLFSTIRDYVKGHIREIQETARQIAFIDCIVSLSEAASRYNYIRPVISNNREIMIRDGRHPVIERLLSREMFVPNDTSLNHRDSETIIITGPNMAGKSTYMRQVALLVLMAQAGSFIPAREAVISPIDRLFTRVGASDDLATGQSTFMVEMNEVAQIIKHATPNSLIILDEIGRGTSTFDGMSIARAVIEYIHEKVKAKTLFATHYHELTEMAENYRGLKNYTVAIKERGNDIVFLRRIVPGGADKSYGIHVAQLAGLPKKIIERAHQILHNLEQNNNADHSPVQTKAATTVVSLFATSISDELLSLDIMTMTPLEALNTLYKLQQQAKEEAGLI